MPAYPFFGYVGDMDPIEDIFRAFDDSPTKLARATGFPVQTVCDWRRKGAQNIPHWRRPAVLAVIDAERIKIAASTRQYLSSATPRPTPQAETL